MIARPEKKGRQGLWWILLVFPLLLGAKPGEEYDISPCVVAREIAIKGVFIFDHQPDQGMAALEKAYQTCPTDFGVSFNLGLANYLADNKEKASLLWEVLHTAYPEHEKTLTNLAWVKFELGHDNEANKLATKGLATYPKSWALAHTRVFSLFRMGRYLEAYDWLRHAGLSGIRAEQWRKRAAAYVVETEWRKFRRNNQIQAVRQAVNLLVRWYPEEPIFIGAKDNLLLAHLDKSVSAPYPTDLPHEAWEKTGNVDDQSVILDDHIKILPPVADWEKRSDAFAVIVGISHYKRLRARHFSDRDANNVRQLLVGRGIFNDDVDHVRTRIDHEATRDTLEGDLQWLIRQGQLNSNAILVFYFSGLGVPWQTGQTGAVDDALLIPVETGMQEISPETTISMVKLKKALEKLPNKNIIVILDTCFNGTVACAVYDTGTQISPKTDGRAEEIAVQGIAPTQEFFASRHAWTLAALQKGLTLYGPGRQGSLTYFMLKGLLGDGDGADGSRLDGWVDLAEAFAFTKKSMQSQESDLFLSQPAKIRLTKAAGEK